MRKLIFLLLLLFTLAVPVSASEFTAPSVPVSGQAVMPENTESFAEGFRELLQKVLLRIRPDLADAAGVSLSVCAAVMLTALMKQVGGKTGKAAVLAGGGAICSLLLGSADTMIRLGAETVTQLSEYGKLFFPVLTAALAAQGGLQTSAALYVGTAAFDMVLSSLVVKLLIPMVYLFLALAAANAVTGEGLLKRMRDMVKGLLSWTLKLLLTVFTTYMSITGVVSGTTDAAALKATKVTISSVVPVVGGILSDASEAVLVSAEMMKNAAGIYGILAVLALFLEPFLRIGSHYLILKGTSALSSVFGSGELSALIEDFGSAMGLLLAMTGSVCLMQLISAVCFMKGVG